MAFIISIIMVVIYVAFDFFFFSKSQVEKACIQYIGKLSKKPVLVLNPGFSTHLYHNCFKVVSSIKWV